MILVVTQMEVLSEKRMELSQTIASLSGSVRMKKGCQRCEFFRSIEDEDRFCLVEEWDTQENLAVYAKSRLFKVLRGAMHLLKEPYERKIGTIFHPEGWRKFTGRNDYSLSVNNRQFRQLPTTEHL